MTVGWLRVNCRHISSPSLFNVLYLLLWSLSLLLSLICRLFHLSFITPTSFSLPSFCLSSLMAFLSSLHLVLFSFLSDLSFLFLFLPHCIKHPFPFLSLSAIYFCYLYSLLLTTCPPPSGGRIYPVSVPYSNSQSTSKTSVTLSLVMPAQGTLTNGTNTASTLEGGTPTPGYGSVYFLPLEASSLVQFYIKVSINILCRDACSIECCLYFQVSVHRIVWRPCAIFLEIYSFNFFILSAPVLLLGRCVIALVESDPKTMTQFPPI